VLEVGIGGRLDATNVCCPRLSVITPISYDHMDLLGPTLGRIATEKAGIVRPGRLVVIAPQAEEARAAILAACSARDARCLEVGRDVTFEIAGSTLEGSRLVVHTPATSYEDVHVPLPGRHQATNAAVAIAAAEALRDLDTDAVRRALAGLRWPARSEILADRPTVFVDVAHNPASMLALRATLRELFSGRRIVLVFGMIASHDPAEPAAIVAPLADEVIVTTPLHVRPVPAEELAQVVRAHNPRVTVRPDREDALEDALSRTRPQDVLLVTGSFFLVGVAREWLLERLRRAPVL
jgi:dihydrofolate synthase/folylpolyglutamate synthase